MEIEGCGGGGGRSDAGMASYVHRFWTSDNIDAVSRTQIQRGFLAFLPPELMGSHVGASPAHATAPSWRTGSRFTRRGAICCTGSRPGSAPEFLLFVIRTAPPLDRRPQPLRLPFLAEAGEVALQLLRIGGGTRGYAMHSAALFEAMCDAPQRFSGSWLAHAGLPLPPLKAESVAIFHGVALWQNGSAAVAARR